MKSVEMNISAKSMIQYLQRKMDNVKEFESKYSESLHEEGSWGQQRYFNLIDDMISCKEMVEALIGMPVNLQQDGRVTVGF